MALEGRILVSVAMGGALGALLRYGAAVWMGRALFPYATLTVNVVGSFVLGLILFHDLARGSLDPTARAFFAIGLLGAFTTMSTFSYETFTLYSEGRAAHAAANVALNLVLSVLAIVLGRSAALFLAEATT